MPENKFEKKVQQEMLGFRVKPSAEVWPKVEERIRKKKKRRVFIIIFLIAGLALLGYWQSFNYFNAEKSLVTGSDQVNSENKLNNDSVKILSIPGNKDHTIINEDPGTENYQTDINKLKPDNRKNRLVNEVIKPDKNRNADFIKPVEPAISKQQLNEISKKEKDQPMKTAVSTDSSAKTIVEETGQVVNKTINTDSSSSAPLKSGIVNIGNPGKKDSIQINNLVVDELIKSKESLIAKKALRWGVHFTPGISMLNDRFFYFGSTKSADLAFISGSGAGTPPAGPSESKAGFAFQAGGFLQKDISPRLPLTAGLQYSYYSDRIRIGSPRDSLLNLSSQLQSRQDASVVYNAGNTTRNYTNRYHFIELPVSILVQLNKKTDQPFYLSMEFKASRLISTNALVYDTAFGGIYYNSDRLFNKTHFSLSTGLMWSVQSKKLQWSFGPVFEVYLNQLLDNPLDKNKYLMMPGLKSRILFPVKNIKQRK